MGKLSDSTPEEVEANNRFIEELKVYHQRRGTSFEPTPKIGPAHVDLLRLYKRVTSEGGYDRVSDTRNNKLAWRRIAQEFLPLNANMVQFAFQVKTTYYKNLAAYEISTFHNREPPPKEILEDLTAKGGDLLNRTLENYHRRATNRDVDMLANGVESDTESNEHATPRADRMDIDDAHGSAGRVTRGLRHAPAQRVLFGQQPEYGARPARALSNHSPTPQNGYYGSSGGALSMFGYEPRQVAPSLVKAVATPANNPAAFRDLIQKQKDALRRNRGIVHPRGMMMPGTGFTGPNIYVKTVMALTSGVTDEIKYALHHLVKISHERGEKFRFDQFSQLGDELLQAICNVSTLWYEHPGWEYTYADRVSDQPNLLNELNGTTDLIRKLRSFPPQPLSAIRDEDFYAAMGNIDAALLVLRNMVFLEENSKYMAGVPLVRDMLTIVLQLPRVAETVEARLNALEIAEQLTKYWALDADDCLYQSLIETIENNASDRGVIITGLRALSRVAMNLEAPNTLEGIPSNLLTRICQWLLVPDDEIQGACLGFLYQYTAILGNVHRLVELGGMDSLLNVLISFLSHNAVRVPLTVRPDTPVRPVSDEVSEVLPKLATSIMENICMLADPKEQSSAWLRCCFTEDPAGEITQLALWSAYNEAFNNVPSEPPLMVAKDFITNVTNVFPTALARVVHNEQDPTQMRYTMKGISARATPVDFRGRAYTPCLWKIPVRQTTETADEGDENILQPPENLSDQCDFWFSPTNAAEMWVHVVEEHLEVPRDNSGPTKFNDGTIRGSGRSFACLWAGCNRYPAPGIEDAHRVSMHVKVHLPDHGPGAQARARFSRDRDRSPSPPRHEQYRMNTPVDDRGNPVGLPLSGVLVLRNLARQMLKIDEGGLEAPEEGDEEAPRPKRRECAGLVLRYFGAQQQKIFYTASNNDSLRHYMPELLDFVSRGMHLGYGKPKLGGQNEH